MRLSESPSGEGGHDLHLLARAFADAIAIGQISPASAGHEGVSAGDPRRSGTGRSSAGPGRACRPGRWPCPCGRRSRGRNEIVEQLIEVAVIAGELSTAAMAVTAVPGSCPRRSARQWSPWPCRRGFRGRAQAELLDRPAGLAGRPALKRAQFCQQSAPFGFGQGGFVAEQRLDGVDCNLAIAPAQAGLTPAFSGSGRPASMCASGNPAISAAVMVRSLAAKARYSFSSRFSALTGAGVERRQPAPGEIVVHLGS